MKMLILLALCIYLISDTTSISNSNYGLKEDEDQVYVVVEYVLVEVVVVVYVVWWIMWFMWRYNISRSFKLRKKFYSLW